MCAELLFHIVGGALLDIVDMYDIMVVFSEKDQRVKTK